MDLFSWSWLFLALYVSVMDMNVVLLIWVGVGGFIATLMDPLVLGSLWRGVTRVGALAGFWAGAVIFIFIHGGFVTGQVFEDTTLAWVLQYRLP